MLLYQKPTRTIRVDVTQADIDAGKRATTRECMVALALKREINDWVEVCHAGYMDPTGMHTFPPGVAERILAWDLGSRVEPFSFELTVPVTV